LSNAAIINKIALSYDLGLAARTVALILVDYDCARSAEVTLADERIELELLAAADVWAVHVAHLRASQKFEVGYCLKVVFVELLSADLLLTVFEYALERRVLFIEVVNHLSEELVVVDSSVQIVVAGDLLFVAVHADVFLCMIRDKECSTKLCRKEVPGLRSPQSQSSLTRFTDINLFIFCLFILVFLLKPVSIWSIMATISDRLMASDFCFQYFFTSISQMVWLVDKLTEFLSFFDI